MSAKRKKPRARTYKPGTPAAQYDFVRHCQRLVAARIKAGLYHDDPVWRPRSRTSIQLSR